VQIATGVAASLGTMALVVFLTYWNGEVASLTRSRTAQISIPLWLIAGFAALTFLLSGILVWLMWKASAKPPAPVPENENHYRELCDSAFDLIDMFTPGDGKFVYTNVAWRQALGYSAEEATNLRLQDVVHPEDWPFSDKAVRALAAGAAGHNAFEVRFLTKTGDILNLEGTSNCRREKGKPVLIRGILRDVTARKRAERELQEVQRRLQVALAKEQELARVDPLTHLSNRRAFYEAAEIEISRAWRYSRPLCLAYVDVDNFKLVNDRLGHSTGDALLVTLAGTLRTALRASDLIARMGGDEFAVLLPETDGVSAELVLQKLQESLRQAMQQSGWNVTFSVGAASFPKPPGSLEAMIRAADEEMYAVKARGKNAVAVKAAQ
jgi:diguanylate cyclase (GGDEF)-like protein/PAS domain S-box-containing protein